MCRDAPGYDVNLAFSRAFRATEICDYAAIKFKALNTTALPRQSTHYFNRKKRLRILALQLGEQAIFTTEPNQSVFFRHQQKSAR